MYGLVNNGIRTFVIDAHGEAMWDTICNDAGVSPDEFENMTAYSDTLTFGLVGAVSNRLGLPQQQVLEVFGAYWVGYSGSTAIGRLIVQGGETLWDRIRGLDDMHEKIQMTMPDLEPPSFDLESGPDGSYRLHYHSKREGLAPMVVGLLHGLAEECGVKLQVDHIEVRSEKTDHDVFALRIIADAVSA